MHCFFTVALISTHKGPLIDDTIQGAKPSNACTGPFVDPPFDFVYTRPALDPADPLAYSPVERFISWSKVLKSDCNRHTRLYDKFWITILILLRHGE